MTMTVEIQKAKKWFDKNEFSNWIVPIDDATSFKGMVLKKGDLMVEYEHKGDSCHCMIRDADDFGAFKYEVEEMENFTSGYRTLNTGK